MMEDGYFPTPVTPGRNGYLTSPSPTKGLGSGGSVSSSLLASPPRRDSRDLQQEDEADEDVDGSGESPAVQQLQRATGFASVRVGLGSPGLALNRDWSGKRRHGSDPPEDRRPGQPSSPTMPQIPLPMESTGLPTPPGTDSDIAPPMGRSVTGVSQQVRPIHTVMPRSCPLPDLSAQATETSSPHVFHSPASPPQSRFAWSEQSHKLTPPAACFSSDRHAAIQLVVIDARHFARRHRASQPHFFNSPPIAWFQIVTSIAGSRHGRPTRGAFLAASAQIRRSLAEKAASAITFPSRRDRAAPTSLSLKPITRCFWQVFPRDTQQAVTNRRNTG